MSTSRFPAFAFTLLALALAPGAVAQEAIVDGKTLALLQESLSGERAKDHVIQITRHHRIQGSRGYRDAANYVLAELKKCGFTDADAYVESFPSDGKVVYQTWQSPSGWDIESAELSIVEPAPERLVGYPEIAMSVITYSNAGDATAELVWVGPGDSEKDYEGKDVAGKFVLATGYGGAVHRLAVLKHGAKAVVCYLDDERAADHPDMLQYTGMWPKTDELEKTTFGFNLTNRQGKHLRELLDSGKKVVLHGRVTGRGLEPFFMDVVVAHIRGTEKPDDELVFSAHLDHPKESANDNASGSGAILDIARSLHELIDSGRLPKPKRSFRFLWVPEWNGTMAYIDKHPELVGPRLQGKFLADLNLDMVGEDLEKLHSKLVLTRTPDSLPSALNDVVEEYARAVEALGVRTPRGGRSAFHWDMTPYSGGSDHMMFIDRKIPAVMFSHEPDYTHHTSEDTPDKVDPVELERCELIATGALWYLANLSEEQGLELAHLVAARSSGRLAEAARGAHALAARITGPENRTILAGESMVMLAHAMRREQEAVRSVGTFVASPRVGAALTTAVTQLSEQTRLLRDDVEQHTGASGAELVSFLANQDVRVPVRATRGPLDFGLPESKLAEPAIARLKSKEIALSGDIRFELVNFVDGKLPVSAIRDAVSAEFGPQSLEAVKALIEALIQVGALKWK